MKQLQSKSLSYALFLLILLGQWSSNVYLCMDVDEHTGIKPPGETAYLDAFDALPEVLTAQSRPHCASLCCPVPCSPCFDVPLVSNVIFRRPDRRINELGNYGSHTIPFGLIDDSRSEQSIRSVSATTRYSFVDPRMTALDAIVLLI